MSNGVIGRSAELAAGEAFLDVLVDGPCALVLRGEAGIGKTAVWEEIAASASRRGLTVLECRPAEAEASLSYVGLADLLGPVAGPMLPELPTPQRRALEVALLRADPRQYAADRRAVGAALREVLSILAVQAPVVLAIDDLHWLDRPTARAIEFALRRLAPSSVGLLGAARTPSHLVALDLSRILTPGRLQEIDLGPLSVGALYQVLRQRLDHRFSRPLVLRIEEASGGNPLFALEIGRELLEQRISASPGEPIPLPESLLALVERRTRALPRSTRAFLAAVAALSRPTTDVLEAALGEDAADRSLERAERARLVETERGAIRFVHPVFASASYRSIPPSERRAIHRLLAQAVENPEERARHLALGSPRRNEDVASALDLAADLAAARGAPATAAELTDLAVELTPLSNQDGRLQRLLRSMQLHATAGAVEEARALGDVLLPGLASGPLRAEALLALAQTEDDLERMTELVETALGEPDVDDLLRARLLGQLAEARVRRGLARDALEPARRGLELATGGGSPRVELGLAAHLAMVEFWSGERGPGALLDDDGQGPLRDWVTRERRSDLGLAFSDSPRASLALQLVHFGHMDEARGLLAETLEDATERGDELTRARALWQLAALEGYAGNWARSTELVDGAAELEEQLGVWSGPVAFTRAWLAVMLGRVGEAEALVEEGVGRAREASDVPYELLLLGVHGYLHFSLGDPTRAADVLCPVVERALEISEPRTNRYWPDAIEALVASGDLERAGRYLELYAEGVTRLRVPRSLARLAHCRGVLLAATRERDWSLASFAEALEIHGRCPNVFERARTLLALGTARRRFKQRRAAREAMEEALGIFEQLPAPLWVARAHEELARTGAQRGADRDELTETESHVAHLAARGLTNREIATQAHLTPKSVENVLARVYRKLGIHSRAELGARMATRT
jgi:DNA-binding CsgD family transcriptional regulator